MSIRVAIVEDSANLRDQWERMITTEPGMKCVCCCDSAETALHHVPLSQPDVVLMDIGLPGMCGIECASRLHQALPQTHIMMVTVYNDSSRIFQALQAGASGYLLKGAGGSELLRSIAEVTQGGAPMSGSIARKVIESFQRPSLSGEPDASLSSREEEILAWLARGYTNKEIGERLAISANTVGVHVQHIYKKLHVRSRVEAAAKCPQ